MKRLIYIIIVLLYVIVTANAQTSEVINELTPVPKNAKKFSKKLPKISSSFFDESNLKFNVKIEPVNLPNDETAVAIIIQTSNKNLVFEEVNGVARTKVSIYGRIASGDKKINGFFENYLFVNVDSNNFKKFENDSVILRKIYNLPKGKYKLGIIVRDNSAVNRGAKLTKFQVPQIKP